MDDVWTGNNEVNDEIDELPRHRYVNSGMEGETNSEEMVDGLESLGEMSTQESRMKRLSWEKRLKWWKVYGLHFLFMWNSRMFEFVSVSRLKPY